MFKTGSAVYAPAASYSRRRHKSSSRRRAANENSITVGYSWLHVYSRLQPPPATAGYSRRVQPDTAAGYNRIQLPAVAVYS
jgi:hypothetical protein